jgi:hypothetical protein
MADKIKMAAKHKFFIDQSIFMQINSNLGFEKRNIAEITFFQNFKMVD